jgi:peroxin-7
MTTRFKTDGFQGYSCEFSPFFGDILAIASCSNFGIVGNGRLWILNTTTQKVIQIFDTQDGLFDVSWSEVNEHQIVTSSGDGSIQLFDISQPTYPIRKYKEHSKEVFSVNWNFITKNLFLSASWDLQIKLVI